MKSNIKKLWIGILILAIACLATMACVIGVKASNVVDESVLKLEDNADIKPISQKIVPVPAMIKTSTIYNGQDQTVTSSWFSGLGSALLEPSVGRDVGSYSCTLSLPHNDRYEYVWETGDDMPIRYTWYITPKAVVKPTVNGSTSFTYTGNAQGLSFSSYDGTAITITGATQTNAGTYTAIASLTSTKNYEWTTGGTTSVTFSWQIVPRSVAVPTLAAGQTFIYNGNAQTVKLSNYDTNAITIIGATQTNAGSYYVTASLKSTTNYKWSGGGSGNMLLGTWTITPKLLTKPTILNNLTYNGTEQTVGFNNFDSAAMNVSGNKGTDAKSYTATISLKSTTNYKWSDNTTTGITLSWKIDPKSIVKPTLVAGQSFTYNGNPQTVKLNSYDSAAITITGTTQTNAGTHYVTASLKSTTNYKWSTGGTTNVSLSWTINPKSLTKPSNNGTFLTYNGSEQTMVFSNFDSATMNVSGNKGTNVGIYNATISLKSTLNYKWSTGSSADFTLPWRIDPKILTKPSIKSNLTYTGSEQTVAFNNFDTTTMNVSGNKGTNANTYTATISLKSTTNYNWSTGGAANFTLQWKIDPKSIALPTLVAGQSFTYNGNAQTVSLNSYDTTAITITGTTQTNAGSYYVTASLKSTTNYKWSTGGIANFTLSWTIARKSIEQPTALADNVFVYTGSNISYIPNGYNANQMDIVGNVQSEVGKHTASVTPNSNHMWNNGTTSAVTFAFEIIPAGLTLRQNISLDYIYNDNGIRKSYGASYRHKLNDSELNIVNGETRYILGNIQAGTSIGEFLQSLQSDSSLIVIQDVNGYVLYDGLNNIANNDKLVATGYEVILYKDSTGAEILDRVYLSVLGDLTGDGQINSADMALLNRILNKEVDVTKFSLELRLATMLNNNGILTGVDREIMHNIIKDIDDTNNYFADKEVTSDYLIFELNGNKRVNKALTENSLVEGAVVGNITQGTKASEFVSKMQSQGINISLNDVHRANNASLNENDIVGTGCYFTYNGNKIILTILGDVTGDGRVNAQDRLVIDRVASGGIKFSDMLTAVKLASLINNNGAVTSTDSEIIWQSIIGKVDINKYISL